MVKNGKEWHIYFQIKRIGCFGIDIWKLNKTNKVWTYIEFRW